VNVRDISMTMSASTTSLRSLDARITGLDRTYTVQFEEGHDEFELCRTLMNNPDVDFAVPVLVHNVFYQPNDPRFTDQHFLTTIRAPQAWDITKGSKDVVIAIIDTGTDWMHEDLADAIWINTKEIPNNGIDDDANGFIDDVRGWDFVGSALQSQADKGTFFPDNDTRMVHDVTDPIRSHGTHVAGIVAAQTNNGKGIAGVGHDCRILPIKCGTDVPHVPNIYRGYEAIVYAADMGADIINCSWGFRGLDPAGQSAVDYALSKGCLVIAAAGNQSLSLEDHPASPAALDGVMSVGSSARDDSVSSFTNHGWRNSLYAPGEFVVSTKPGNRYDGQSGTSMSCPVTSGVAALIKSLHPDWTPLQLMLQMRMTVDELQGVDSSERHRYFGRINAEKAVAFNRTWTSLNAVPGIVYQSHSLSTGGIAITSTGLVTANITMINYLADAQSSTVTIEVLDDQVDLISESEVTLPAIRNNQTTLLPLRISLAPSYPWYQATILIRLTIRTGNALNILHIEIPTSIASDNIFSRTATHYDPSVKFHLLDVSRDSNIVFAMPGPRHSANGYMGTPDSGRNMPTILRPMAIEVISPKHFFVGGYRDNNLVTAHVSPSTTDWSIVHVTDFLSTIDAIHAFDTNNVLIIGNGVGGRLGVGQSTDGADSWRSINTGIEIDSPDAVVSKAVVVVGNNVWVGTTSGRIFRSTNRGQTWTQADMRLSGEALLCLEFRDRNNGLALYRSDTGESAIYRLATTLDGGETWILDVFPVNSLRITPISISSPGGHFVLFGSRGEAYGSDDNGSSWQPIYSRPAGETVSGISRSIGGETMLILGGNALNVLRYKYVGPNGTRILTASEQSLDFGTVVVDYTSDRSVEFTNVGTSDVVVSSVDFLNENNEPVPHFEMVTSLPPVIRAGTSNQLRIRFQAPLTIGTYRATAVIVVDGTPSEFHIPLIARVDDPSSVADLTQTAHLAPNPVTDAITITFTDSRNRDIHIIDGTGRHLLSVTSESPVVRLSTSDLSPGQYTILVRDGLTTSSARIVVIR